MKFFLNEKGEVDFNGVSGGTTVQELLDEIDKFLEEHPVNCSKCKGACCKKKVSVDGVFVKRNCRGNLLRFLDQKLELEGASFFLRRNFSCKFLNGLNRCEIYNNRPLICRLYMCLPYSEKYKILEGLLVAVFALAFTHEVVETRASNPKEMESHPNFNNPALHTESYDLPLKDIVTWGKGVLINYNDEAYQELCSVFE